MTAPTRLRVDWTRCDGHGLCRALAPDLVDLDEWGFPIVHDTEHADDATLRQLASVCPALALYLEPTHQ